MAYRRSFLLETVGRTIITILELIAIFFLIALNTVKRKDPVLGIITGIPPVMVLGWLFGHEATVKRETEMIVVLTPKIKLGTEADFEMASDEDKLVRRQVEHKADLTLPKTEWGFDQWLIGSDM